VGLSIQELHALEQELRATRRKIAPLHHRWQRAGAFKTRDRIDAKIEEVETEIGALEKRLIDSWEV